MSLNFRVIQPWQDPNDGRVDINYNFDLLRDLNLSGGTTGSTSFDILTGSSINGWLRLTTYGGSNIDIEIPKVENRVVSGLTASYSGESSLDLNIDPGTYTIQDIYYTINSATTFNIASGTSQYDRIDAIVGTTSGLTILSGTPNINPATPVVDYDYSLIAYVSVPGLKSNLAFDGNRTVTRDGVPKINVGGSDLIEWVENYFFPFDEATVSINSFSLQETGTTYSPTIQYRLTPNQETEIFDRRIVDITLGSTIFNPGSNSVDYPADPITSNNTYRNEADVGNNGNPTTKTSNNSTVEFIYPWFYGMDINPNLAGTIAYATLTKSIQKESNKSVTFNGADEYIYIVTPDDWDDLSKVIDQNGFDVTGTFDGPIITSISSVGLDINWTRNYKLYRTGNLTTVNSGGYTLEF